MLVTIKNNIVSVILNLIFEVTTFILICMLVFSLYGGAVFLIILLFYNLCVAR